MNNNKTVTIGNTMNEETMRNSPISIKKSIKRSMIIRKVFTSIPIPREKPTKPSLYSFFSGLKKVVRLMVRANACMK